MQVPGNYQSPAACAPDVPHPHSWMHYHLICLENVKIIIKLAITYFQLKLVFEEENITKNVNHFVCFSFVFQLISIILEPDPSLIFGSLAE